MILEFNNNNLWEVTNYNDASGEYIVCLSRKGNYEDKERINENNMQGEGQFDYNEWKTYFTQSNQITKRLDELDFPIVYYAMFILDYPIIEKVYRGKYVFHKYDNAI